MATTLKPYPSTKNVSIEWLDEVPENWKISTVKSHYEIQLGKMLQPVSKSNSDKKVHYLKVKHVQWFSIDKVELPMMWVNAKEIEKYSVHSGDLLVCEGGEGGRCSLVEEEPEQITIIQNALHRVRPLSDCSNSYLQYIMASISAFGWFESINSKATISHFTKEKFKRLKIPIPSSHEQNVIVRYLDYKENEIQKFIQAKRKLIELFKEQKLNIIHSAVTRGLESTTQFKESGIEWLGKIPVHWTTSFVKNYYNIQPGKMLQSEKINTSDLMVHYITVRHVQWAYIQNTNLPEMWANPDEIHQLSVYPGDLLVCEGGEGGRCSIVNSKFKQNTIIQNHIHRVRPSKYCSNDFLRYIMVTISNCGWFDAINSGATIPNLSKEKIATLKIPIPPIHEQTAIVKILNETTKKIESNIKLCSRQIDLMHEYRARLISDVVTGKLDVREVTLKLLQNNYDSHKINIEQ